MPPAVQPPPVPPSAPRAPHPGRRLVVVAAIVAFVLAATGAGLAWQNYRAERGRVLDQHADLARAAATDAAQALRERLSLLAAAATVPSIRAGDPSGMAAYFYDLAAAQPRLTYVVWADPAGTVRAGTPEALADAPVTIADTPPFRAIQGGTSTYAGAVDALGLGVRAGIALAVPTRDLGGTRNGVLLAKMTIEELEDALSEFQGPGDALLLVVDRHGRLIVDGDPATAITDVSGSPLLSRAAADPSALLTDTRGLRGQDGRLVAVAAVPDSDWLVLREAPADAAFRPARRTLLTTLTMLASLTLAALAGALWTGGRLDHAAAAQEQALHASETFAAENAALYHEAQRALAVRDEFLSSLSHDLRTPLTSVKAYAQMLGRRVTQTQAPDKHDLLQGLAAIEAGAARMAALVDELLDIARLQTGRPLELARRRTDLVALARRATEAHQELSNRHLIRLESDLPELVGWWDPDRLQRVLDNLLSNAVKYSPDGGTIRLTLARERSAAPALPGSGAGHSPQNSATDWAVLTVTDEGIGIPAADLPHVFERFRRGRNVVGRIAGTGIGLSGAKAIVEQHGGTIAIASREGAGTTVTVRLPVCPASGASAAGPDDDNNANAEDA
jgi:signal transduction histidine kinase